MSNKSLELWTAAGRGEVDKVRGLLLGMTPAEVNCKDWVSECIYDYTIMGYAINEAITHRHYYYD